MVRAAAVLGSLVGPSCWPQRMSGTAVADSGQLSSQAMLLLPSPLCAGCDFLTVLGAHEGEGLVVEHDAAVSVHASPPACQAADQHILPAAILLGSCTPCRWCMLLTVLECAIATPCWLCC